MRTKFVMLVMLAAAASASLAVSGSASTSAVRQTMVIAVQEVPTTLDPSTYQASALMVLQAVQDPYFFYAPRRVAGSDTKVFNPRKLVLGLVSSWKLSSSEKYLQITLRKGVKSPYGNTLTTADVQWTVQRNIATKSLGGAFAFGQAGIDLSNPITIVDSQTFRWNLTRLSPNLLKVLVFHWEAPFDSTEAKKHATSGDPWAAQWLATNSAGFGAYNVTSFTPGQSVTFAANPNYWAGKVAFKSIVIRAVPDPGNRQALVQQGSVQLVPDLPRLQWIKLASDKRVKREIARSSRMLYLVMNNRSKPFDDPRVRQAVAWALPYTTINQRAYGNTATISRGPISPILQYYLPKLWPYATNVAKAKSLLAAAGYPNGFTVSLRYSLANPGPENEQTAIIIRDGLAKVGINVQLTQEPSDATFYAEMLARKVQVGLTSTAPFVPDAGYQLANTGLCAGASNFADYCNSSFDSYVNTANATTSPGKRLSTIAAGQGLWARDIPMIPILTPNYGIVEDPKLTGFVGSQTGYPYLRYLKAVP